MLAERAGTRRIPVQTQFPLEQVAEILPTFFSAMSFGDTDHDGRNEVMLLYNEGNLTFRYKVIEEQGNNVYSVEYSGPDFDPYETGDPDRDGKAEIIGGGLAVLESPDATSHPSELAWFTPTGGTVVGFPTVGDTDRDGRMEIIHSVNFLTGPSNLVIFENTADNSFTQVYLTTVGQGAMGEKVIADLDGDGLVEIAFSGLHGRVYVYESRAYDSWELAWTEPTELRNAYAAEGGRDTDGNGRPELFVMGNSPTGGWTTIVYEPVCDNHFTRVANFGVAEPFIGAAGNALGNLDGVGGEEYLMEGNCCLWVYQATAPGHWEIVQEITDPTPNGSQNGLFAHDVNRNGKDEVFWTGGASTLVLEHPGGTSNDSGEAQPRSVVFLSPFPNPCGLEASLRTQFILECTPVLSVYTVNGRLVERRTLTRDAAGQLVWPVQQLSSGIYLLRLEDQRGATLAVGRGSVVR